MFKKIIAGILSAAIVFSSLTPAVNATEAVVVSQEETENEETQDVIEEEIVENVEEEAIVLEAVAEEVLARTLDTEMPLEEGERAVIKKDTCGGNLTWVFYDNGELVISGSGAMDIGADSFRDYNWYLFNDEVTKIIISDDVSSIGNYAFEEFKNVVTVVLPKKLKTIGSNAFWCCQKLKNIEFPEELVEIESNAFGGCSSLEKVTFPESLEVIGYYAFGECESLKSIEFPGEVIDVESCAFKYCEGLESVVLPENLGSIEKELFYGCSNLKEVRIQEGITAIGKSAFNECKNLEKVWLPQSVTYIDESAFGYFTNVKVVYYAGTWEQWEVLKAASSENMGISDGNICTQQKYSFKDNGDGTATITGIEEGGLGGNIQIPEEINGLKVTTIGEKAFLNNKIMKSVTFPSSVEKIEASAFYGCKLKEINFATGLKYIMEYAFYNAIDSYNYTLILPDGLEFIGSNAFSEIYVKSVTVPATVSKIGFPAFDSREDIIFDDSAQKWLDIHNANTKNIPTLETVSFLGSKQAYVPYLDSEGNITGYELALWKDASGDIVIPEKFNEFPVISIRQLAFENNEEITSVTIPENINSVGAGVFYNCVNLLEAKIYTKDTSVPWQLFQGCISLEKVTLPPFTTYVGTDSFDHCISLKEVFFESS